MKFTPSELAALVEMCRERITEYTNSQRQASQDKDWSRAKALQGQSERIDSLRAKLQEELNCQLKPLTGQ